MERLNRSPLSTAKLAGAFLVVAGFLVVLQLAALNFLQVLYVLAREGRAPGALASGIFILKHAWPVSAAALFSAALLAPLLRVFRGNRREKVLSWAYSIWMTLLGTVSTALFFAALVGSPLDAPTLWNRETWKPVTCALMNPVVFFSLLVFVAAGVVAFQAVWFQTVSAFCRVFFHVKLPGVAEATSAREYLSGDDFLDQLKGLVSLAAREKRALGIMGIRFTNELDLIQQYGRAVYDQAMESLFVATRQIARRGEFQLLYRSNLVLSVLFADEAEATLGAKRFHSTLNRLLQEKHPAWNLTVAVGVGGVRFQGALSGEAALTRMVEHLFWAASDQATRGAESGKVPVVYTPAS